MAENRVADVIEMRRLAVVEHEHILQFARISDHAIVADNDVLAHIGVVADLAVAPDDGRAFNHHAVLDHRACADEHLFADVSRAFATVVQAGFQMSFNIAVDFLQRLPGVFTAFEQRGIPRLAQVEQVGRFEHGE